MILQKTDNTLAVETSGDFKELAFGVRDEDMGLILEILRSKMYRNPIGSICREIASNARDANREVGNINPIEIAIQDSIWLNSDLCIAFRDKGPGISPERIADVFVNYGASTKRDSNSQTGGFGLGAKTPFSYTDNFSIVTIVDGIEYAYTAVIDEGRRGKLYLCDKKETTEANGTTIVVPIKSASDRAKFEEEVYKATYFWIIRPTYTKFETEMPETKIRYEHETCSLIEQDIVDTKYNLLIDGIIYPLDSDIMKFANHYGYGCNNASVFLEFDNGDLTISANRESVQYDKPTIEAIQKKFDDFLAHLAAHVTDRINTSSNYLEACIRYSQMQKESFELSVLQMHCSSDRDQHDRYKIKFGKDEVDPQIRLRHLVISVVRKSSEYAKKRDSKHTFDSDFLLPIYFLDKGATSLPKNRTLFAKHDKFLVIEFAKELYKWSELSFKDKKKCAHKMRGALEEIEYLKSIGLVSLMYSSIDNTRAEVSSTPKEDKPVVIYTRVAHSSSEFQSYELSFFGGKILKNGTKDELDRKKVAYEPIDSLRNPECIESSEVEQLRKWAYLLHLHDIEVFFVSKGAQYFVEGKYPRLKDMVSKVPAKKFQEITDYGFISSLDEDLDAYKDLNFQDETISEGLKYIEKLREKYGSTHGRRDYNKYMLPNNFEERFPVSEELKLIREKLNGVQAKYPLLQYMLSDLRYRYGNNSETKAKANEYIRLVDNDRSRLLPVVIEVTQTEKEVKE